MYIMPLAQEGTKIQLDWYTGMEVSSPVSVPWDLGTVPHTYEVYSIPLSACVEVTFCYQLAKISMN